MLSSLVSHYDTLCIDYLHIACCVMMQWCLSWGQQSEIAWNLAEVCVQLHGLFSLLLRKEFPEFVSFDYTYHIAVSQSVTSEKYVDLFYFLVFIYIEKLFTDSLFLLFSVLCYVCYSQNVSHNKSLFCASGLI